MTPDHIILGLLSDDSEMTYGEFLDLTMWCRNKLSKTLAKLCDIKAIKRVHFGRYKRIVK